MRNKLLELNYNFTNRVGQLILGAKLKKGQGEVGISYYEAGPENAPLLVFIHGFADSKNSFFPCALHLVRHYRLLVLDLPGFGESDRPQTTYTLSQYSQWLKNFFDQEGHHSFYLMGNSLGGAICMRLALDHPQLIKKLVLIGSAGVIAPQGHSFYDDILAGNNIFKVNTLEEFDAFLNRIFFKRPYMPRNYLKYLFLYFQAQGQWHEKLLYDLLSNGTYQGRETPLVKDQSFALNAQLQNITHPTLIIWGEHDALFSVEIAQVLAQEIPDSKLVVMKDTGHCPQGERPKEVLGHLKEFLV